MKIKNKAGVALDISTMLMVTFHFIVCGLPALLAIFGSSGAIATGISHESMLYLLAFSGTMLAISAIAYLRGCGCGSGKMRRVQKIGLIIAAVLYTIALIGHFAPRHPGTDAGCHGRMEDEEDHMP